MRESRSIFWSTFTETAFTIRVLVAYQEVSAALYEKGRDMGGDVKQARPVKTRARHRGRPRATWLVAFTMLLVVSSAAPVFASEEPPYEGQAQESSVPPPDGEDIASAIAAIEAKEAEEEAERQSPSAVQEREDSALAFSGISAEEAEGLLGADFADQLAALNADPARFLTDVTLNQPIGEFSARITDANEETELIESAVPVQTEDDNGQFKKVDLELEGKGEGFEPQNPLTELQVGQSVDEGVEVGEESLSITQASPEGDSTGRAFGNKNIFFPEVAADTDLLVSPTAEGVELFDLLRSAESPESLRFQLDVPEGAELRSDSGGGAEVVQGESRLADVPAPGALDAQGAHVPVELEVDGNAVVVNVPREENQFAYPILVDPQWITDSFGWSSGNNLDALSHWRWETSNEEKFLHSTECIYICFDGVHRGLYISTKNVSYDSNKWGEWYYEAPGGTTYIPSIYPTASATISPFNRDNHGCSWEKYPRPYDYDGIWDGSKWDWLEYDRAQWYGNASMFTKGKTVGIGMNSGSGINIPCWRDIRAGGVSIALADPEAPTIYTVIGTSTNWVKDLTIIAYASDPGLGVKGITLFPEGADSQTKGNCSGTYNSLCPFSTNAKFDGAYFLEGERSAHLSAYDPLGPDNGAHVSSSYSFTTKIDRSKPEVELEGQLTEAIEEAEDEGDVNKEDVAQLGLPVYNLKIEAEDGQSGASDGKKKQSGMKNIAVFVDGNEMAVPWQAQTCPESSCLMTETYSLRLNGLKGGPVHHLKVIAKDQVGNERDREIEFEYIPATGIKDEYVMQYFPLPDGEGNEAEEEHPRRPELAVNVMNGNLVFRQKDVDVEGPSVDLELERFYNSQLPEKDDTEWGHGWTLAQTPKLETEETKEEAPPTRASMVRTSGVVESAVGLPTESGGAIFDKKLKAVVTKESGGGYTVEDQSGETNTSLAFDSGGKVKELRTPGFAKIEYDYEEGDLSEVAVHDPTVFSGTLIEEPQKPSEFEAPAYVDSFGGETSGPGRLSRPDAVAIGPNGHLWVADAGHRRIQEFDSGGAFVSEFGIAGPENGQFVEPSGVAVDPSGNVWVADKNLSWIQKFNPEGKFLTAFGGYGTGNGKFTALQGLATDAEGHLWTIDGGKSKPRVQEFSSAGTYITQFGTAGTGDGQLKEPQGIAIDPSGHVWVADTANNRVQEFSSAGTFIRKFGAAGSGNGQLSAPTALCLDAEGNVWVTDAGNDRIEQFSGEGAYLSQFGTGGADNGQFSEPRGIVIDSEGNAWIADSANNRIQEIAAGELVRSFGGEASEGGNLSSPYGVATDPQGDVWVADTEHNRVQEFSATGSFIRQFGAKGSSAGLFSEPHGIATDAEGNVWVADTGNYRIEEFSAKGEFIRQFGSEGKIAGRFLQLWGIAIDPAGHVWAIDASPELSRVQEFSAKGEYIRKFGTFGTAYNQFRYPKGIAADPAGHIWVADTNNNRIAEYTGEGTFIRSAGSQGAGNGQFLTPAALAADPEGNVWVADTENNRVQELSPEGTYLGQFGTPGNEDGQLDAPYGIATDAKGDVWVADTGNDRIQEVAASEFVRKFGGQNSGIGQLSSPYDVAADSQGNVWVADAMHYRLQKFGPSGEPIREVSTFGEGSYSAPLGVATDAEDDLWVAEGQGRVAEFGPQGSLIRRFGSSGTESGQFSSLQDVAVDPEGHVWTIERDPPRVQQFSPAGEFLSSFGTKGTESGQLYEPTAIAADSQGNVWVADTANDRIEEFSPSGEFIRKFGSFGATNGHFYTPEGLSVDAKDNVWVADTYNNRIQVFNSVGTYLGQFGAPGNNYGQFARPQGVATDTEGHVWVADTNNNRAQKWQIPQYVFAHDSVYDSSLASEGTAAGELRHPGDVAVDPKGNLWVADQDNNRIEELDAEGEFIQAFGYEVNKTAVQAEGSEAETNVCTAASGEECQAGKAGSGNGQLDRPTALALDAQGDVWVADAANSRIEEFSDAGEYLGKLGSQGNGEGQLLEPEGVAIDSHGNVWVSDTYQGRVQEFDESGDLIRVVGSQGALGEPVGIDIGPGGNVWVADWQYDQIAEFNDQGEYVYAFGSEGTANGQFRHPDGIAVDSRGEIWVADEGNDRIQAFTEKGEYIAQFGAKGSDEGQFDFGYPIGVATDSQGSLWVADSGNERIQRWGVFNDVPASEAGISEDTPEVQVEESPEGLVESAEGEEAGEISYEHEGQLLSAVVNPEGETDYTYDSTGRLTKVTLPNGTWGKVAYNTTDRRVKSVTVDPAGSEPAKTTYFYYQDSPSRHTTVSPEGSRATVYDIGPDGSVLKWSNTEVPPEIENLSGSLYAEKETSSPIEVGDYELLVKAHSEEGIASIDVIANGSTLVDEKTCDQDWETEERECKTVEDPWVTETGNWPPGILNLEVVVEDANENIESTKFWVNIPYTPPPDPEADEPPKFNEVLRFREEFGLDLDLKGDELAIDERIFNLIGDWYNPHTPSGEIARATWERWGVPLRAVDAAELEYRERYIAQAATVIPQWAEAHASSTYAGYYVDQRQGGIIHVGFTSLSQSQELSQLIAEIGEVAPGRISTFERQPSYSYKELLEAWRADSAALGGQPIAESMVSQAIDMADNRVEVKTEDVAGTESFLAQHSNPGKFEVIHATGRLTLKSLATRPAHWTEGGRPPKYNVREAERRIFGGDALMDAEGDYLYECTAGWGATEPDVTKPNGEVVHRHYVITAGHCFSKGPTVYRFAREGKQYVEFPIGSVTARAFGTPVEGYETDAEAIRLRSGFSPPSWIFANRGYQLRPGAPELPVVGEPVCHAGIEGGHACGTVERLTEQWFETFPEWLWETHIFTCDGDSGGPYWRPEGSPLGIETGGPSHLLPDGRECGKPEYFTPLVESKAEEMGVEVGRNVGVFQAPGLSNMSFHGAVN